MIGVAVIGLAVGPGELDRLDHGVGKPLTQRVHRRQVEILQDLQRLQQHRPLPPRARLADRPAVVRDAGRGLVGGLPAGQVRAGEQRAVALAGHVHHLCISEVVGDGVGHEAVAPRGAGGVDPSGAGAAFGGLDKPLIGRGEVGVAEQRQRLGCCAVRAPDRVRAGPVRREETLEPCDGPDHRCQHRVTVGEIADGRRQNLRQLHASVIAQEQEPAVEGAGHHGGKQPRAGDQPVDARGPHRLDAGGGGRHALRAKHARLTVARRVEQHRQIARRTVEMRLDHLQDEARGHRGVERVAALLEDRHADRRGDPVGRGHHAEGAADLGPCREACHVCPPQAVRSSRGQLAKHCAPPSVTAKVSLTTRP